MAAITKPDPILFINRFLCYGNEYPSYCPRFTKLTLAKTPHLKDMIEDEKRANEVIAEIGRFSLQGSSVNRHALIFALAACAHSKSPSAKHGAYALLPRILLDSSELFTFIDYATTLSAPTSGWGHGQRNSILNWYKNRSAVELGALVCKGKSRLKWTHRDVLRLIHPKATNDGYDTVKKTYAESDSTEVQTLLKYFYGVNEVKHTTDHQVAARFIEEHILTSAQVPTTLYTSKEVWGALAQTMNYVELLNHLGKMTAIGVLEEDSPFTSNILVRITDSELIRESKIHPVEIANLLKMYECGHVSTMSKLNWIPYMPVMEALTNALHTSFELLVPTDKTYCVAVDIAGSSTAGREHGVVTTHISTITAAMVTALVRKEPEVAVFVFHSKEIQPISTNKSMSVENIASLLTPHITGGTDPSKPLTWATEQKTAFDVFLILSDLLQLSNDNTKEALKEYRAAVNPDAKLLVCGMKKNTMMFKTADYNDAGMLDIVGFDERCPQLIAEFARGFK
ncbi:PREDICTED: 60 kDa SS-A/Ro ribonucleoprotein-like isoform X2 [Priapulus caudatus]|uniref:60 kDa SS-A/Ro ribonucleoprotein-like isoform X2 n=1 Tax=Priapulus caudatus TaxID=37621 RepID=A0ABM1DNS2_PRICU|nr:PREDICTED: 60 kDa SS-A/Ro ribonucleoprotein-like isoform X2 [Priapulus caudatus]